MKRKKKGGGGNLHARKWVFEITKAQIDTIETFNHNLQYVFY